jgi:hypothetical protein
MMADPQAGPNVSTESAETCMGAIGINVKGMMKTVMRSMLEADRQMGRIFFFVVPIFLLSDQQKRDAYRTGGPER